MRIYGIYSLLLLICKILFLISHQSVEPLGSKPFGSVPIGSGSEPFGTTLNGSELPNSHELCRSDSIYEDFLDCH